ncbi:MAG: transporter ATP-binding protein [Anaerocolumna sp.]|jgi:ATPase subunit of ABC transporter with duplicated ATPase domains|nr:transporter ATP-binding protein [Anaerocolumna sp.]
MLDIRNVTISNKEDNRVLIENFNFTLNKGDKAVIIGEEGNGKSTLLKFIYNSSLIDDYCEYTGQILGNCKLGYLEQEIEDKWLSFSVKDYLSQVDIYSCSNPLIWTMNLNAELMISDQILGTLSGGEKVKIRLMKLLAEEPDILLLDEPTNDLDMDTLRWLEDFINQSNCPILFVSHDETLIENTANVIIHLEQLKRKTMPKYNIEYMGYKEYVEKRLHGLQKQETIARKQREDYKKQMQRFQQLFEKVEHRQDTISRQDPAGGRLLKKKMKNLKSMEKRFEKNTEEFLEIPDVEEAILFRFPDDIQIPNGKKVLDYNLDKLTVPQDENRVLAEHVSLRVIGAEHVAIIGDNGTGKTTFLRDVANELLERKDIKASYMPQNYEELLDYDMLPIDFLVSSGQKEDITKAFTYMGGMKFTRDEMEHRIGDLSGGQKAKLILLNMILQGCNVLILDEPTRNLSPLSNPVIRGVLSDFNGTIISVTHDRKYIEEVSTVVYKLTNHGLQKVDNMYV